MGARHCAGQQRPSHQAGDKGGGRRSVHTLGTSPSTPFAHLRPCTPPPPLMADTCPPPYLPPIHQTLDEMSAQMEALSDADTHLYGSLYTINALDGQTRQHIEEVRVSRPPSMPHPHPIHTPSTPHPRPIHTPSHHLAPSQCLLEVCDDGRNACALVVGHNKGMEEAASSMAGQVRGMDCMARRMWGGMDRVSVPLMRERADVSSS